MESAQKVQRKQETINLLITQAEKEAAAHLAALNDAHSSFELERRRLNEEVEQTHRVHQSVLRTKAEEAALRDDHHAQMTNRLIQDHTDKINFMQTKHMNDLADLQRTKAE